MPRSIPDDIVEQIRERADILEIISEYLTISKQGRNYTGLCPFHSEKTPSFSVNRDKQMYYCFGCGAGGDIFSFIMNKDKLTFPEVVEKLARKYHIELPKEELSPEQLQKIKRKQRLIEVNQLAVKYYNYLLSQPQGIEAKKYLISRGLNEQEIEKYQLGYAPANWDSFYKLALNRGFEMQELLDAGMVVMRNDKSGCYDRFRNRVLFTIFNPLYEPIGFGGRVLDDSLPKYLNTPETDLFNKGNTLYGLNWSSGSIRQQGYVIIMEGYMDAIAAYKNNIENVVASLGTAFTKEHAALIKRYTNQVVICFDSDTAGVKAALRGLSVLQDERCDVKVVQLPKGMDPDDFLKAEGKDSFLELVDKAKSFIEYKLDTELNNWNKTGNWQLKVFASIKEDLLKVRNAIELEQYIRLVATKLETSETSIREELNKGIKKKKVIFQDKIIENRDTINGSESFILHKCSNAQEEAEKQLFLFAFSDPIIRKQITEQLDDNFFSQPLLNRLYQEAKAKWDNGHEPSTGWIMNKCLNEDEKKIIAKLFNQALPEQDLIKVKLARDCIQVMLNRNKQAQLNDLKNRLKEAEKLEDFTSIKKLLTEIQRLMK